MGVRIRVRLGTRNGRGIHWHVAIGELILGASCSWTRCTNRTSNNSCMILIIEGFPIGIQMIASEKTVKRCKGICCEVVVF